MKFYFEMSTPKPKVTQVWWHPVSSILLDFFNILLLLDCFIIINILKLYSNHQSGLLLSLLTLVSESSWPCIQLSILVRIHESSILIILRF